MHRIYYCLLPLAAAAAAPAQAQSGAWRVSEVSGDVRIAQGGQARPATRGALLSGGSVIAGARSRAVLVRGRQYMVVSPGSTVRVDSPAGAAGSIVDVAVEAGNALFKVDRRENPHFRVRTRFLAAVVRGTTFSVSVTPTGGTVQVTEGAVQVSSLDGGASDLIRPGMIARIGASDLYRLTISGDQDKVIRSPAAPAASVTTPVSQGRAVGLQRQAQAPSLIASPVGEAPVRLSEATNGLVRGRAAINLALPGGRSDSADRDRGSGNDREDRNNQGDRRRDDRDERGDGNGRGDGAEDGKDKDGPANGNGGGNDGDDADKPDKGNEGDNGQGNDDKDEDKPSNGGGNDKDKDEDPDPNGGHGNDDDRGDEDNPGSDGDDGKEGKPGTGDGDNGDDENDKPAKDDGDDADGKDKPDDGSDDDSDDKDKPGKDDSDDGEDDDGKDKDDDGDDDDDD